MGKLRFFLNIKFILKKFKLTFKYERDYCGCENLFDNSQSALASNSSCSTHCSGNQAEICGGGSNYYSIYATNYISK